MRYVILFCWLLAACTAPSAPPPPVAANESPLLEEPVSIVTIDTRGFVILRNLSTEPINLRGWTLQSVPDNQAWTIPFDFDLKPRATVRIRSGHGKNTVTDLYSGFRKDIWTGKIPNKAVLLDPQGVVVSWYPSPGM